MIPESGPMKYKSQRGTRFDSKSMRTIESGTSFFRRDSLENALGYAGLRIDRPGRGQVAGAHSQFGNAIEFEHFDNTLKI